MKYSQNSAPEPEKSTSSVRRKSTPVLICFLYLFVSAACSPAKITIEGISDKAVYNDRVTFKVRSERGYDYTAELDGDPIETDIVVDVNQPDYHELYVYRRGRFSGDEESKLVRFIVRSSQRGNSESGLPSWSPLAPVNSAASEFVGAKLKIIAPVEYPIGLEIPVIARIEDDSGERVGINGVVSANDFQDYPLQLLRGIGSVFLPVAAEPGTLSYAAEIQSLQTARQIAIEPATTWQTVSEDITASTYWGENARIHITGLSEDLLTIASGVTLSIGAGSIIIIDPDIEIAVRGDLIVNGTAERPVVFTAPDRAIPWGGFLFESNSSRGDITGAIFTASGADSNWFSNNPGHGGSHRKDQCLFYISGGARVNLINCWLVENYGQVGHGENSYLTMTGCLVQKFTTIGQFNGGSVIFEDCELIEFPSAAASYVDGDNDAIYLTRGEHSMTDCLVGWTLDDGIDAGGSSAGTLTIQNCWFESCYHEGMALSGPKEIFINDSVFLNCGQGIECGYDGPDVNAVNCLCTSNLVGARFGDNYDWNYDDGFLTVADSFLLFNNRDVWGRAWDDWTVHLDQMDIRSNYLSTANTNHPDNSIWNPGGDPNQADLLQPFLPTPAGTVGIGFATDTYVFDPADIPNKIPVRLSTFTTIVVDADYTIETQDGILNAGSVHFTPGETVKYIELQIPPAEDFENLCVTLSNPVNAELTGYRRITCTAP